MRAIFAILLICLSACSHLLIQRGEEKSAEGPVQRIELRSFIWGFVPHRKIRPEAELCPNGRIRTADLKMDQQDVLLTIVTLGIYIPHRVDITCGQEVSTTHN
jgi:hypothetical protein